jgi:hypothetical protein
MLSNLTAFGTDLVLVQVHTDVTVLQNNNTVSCFHVKEHTTALRKKNMKFLDISGLCKSYINRIWQDTDLLRSVFGYE